MQESLEPPPEPKRTGRNWLDLFLALSAIFVSLCSLYLAYNSSDAMEKLVHANSWPYVQLGSGNTADDGQTAVLIFALANAGTGPARMHSFEFLVDGEPIDRRNLFVNIARACCAESYEAVIAGAEADAFNAIGGVLTTPIAPGVLAPGEEARAMVWARTERNAPLWRAVDQARQRGRLTMRACYCSVFDECWTTESNALPVEHEGACAAGAALTPRP